MRVDKIYVILLHHTQENIEKIQQKLNSLEIDNTPYEITYAHNGHTETHSYQVFDWEKKIVIMIGGIDLFYLVR